MGPQRPLPTAAASDPHLKCADFPRRGWPGDVGTGPGAHRLPGLRGPTTAAPDAPTWHQAAARGFSWDSQGLSGLGLCGHSPVVRSPGPESAAVLACPPARLPANTTSPNAASRRVDDQVQFSHRLDVLHHLLPFIVPGREAAPRPLLVESQRNPTPTGLNQSGGTSAVRGGVLEIRPLGPRRPLGAKAPSPQSAAAMWNSRT